MINNYNANIVGNYEVAAEVFADVAFGENIITILVTEYCIESKDTLNGLLLADIAYDYGFVPIFYQKIPQSSIFMPHK